MRRKASLVLLAVAVFCAAMSPLLRWYAFPRLVKIPPNQYQDAVLEAKNPTLIDYGTMKAKKVPKVTIVQTLKGNVEASERIEKNDGDSSRDVVVWDALSYVQDAEGKMVSKIPERYIFDAHSQEPVHATGEMVDGDPVKREGIEFKWPFLTEKRDYEYFDAQARITRPIHYKGTQDFRGVRVYYFEQTIPWTKVPFPKTMPVKGITPESLAKTGTTRWYTTVRKFWVDPTTGAPVYGEEIQRNELRGGTLLGGRDKVTVFAGHVKMREDYIKSTVDLVKSQRVLVLLMTSYLPWGLLGLGVLLLALALWLEARSRRPGDPAPTAAAEPEPQPANA
ncbi:DUF3068 domain-containing protein [Streptomyces flavofungini]|uniref:DUF3068 domain-containing protein n=1 Tax=Streptomyces flavofungini TaxID=68200 RepID=A0ABS0X306_9ACTN|nr:DUF3068 domain-containing protein [Streptomyces flavofungini]MBJ3807572.1 DUF3068 domain-containing protein [Streptomyces flavofungini]GHC64742.1 hypothetical protein GCM10010349_36070 [Streptomyces flavofungini]